jgi:hypothetical protein
MAGAGGGGLEGTIGGEATTGAGVSRATIDALETASGA